MPHLKARQQFSGTEGWGFYLYDRVLRRTKGSWLPGRGSTARVLLKDQIHPFVVRLGSTDFLVLDEIFKTGEYDFVRNLPRSARHIVDLGANVGFSVRYWMKLYPNARILAVEPDSENCEIFRRNIDETGLSDRVTLVRCCVGSRSGRTTLIGSEEWAYRMSADEQTGEIEVRTFKELLESNLQGADIDLLKCDIEGAERELFRDCSPWIGKVRAIIIELHAPYTEADLYHDIAKSGTSFKTTHRLSGKQCPVLLLQNISVK